LGEALLKYLANENPGQTILLVGFEAMKIKIKSYPIGEAT